MERQLNSRTVFQGRLLTVRVDAVETPDGDHSSREVVAHPGAVGIVPVTQKGTILLIEHFRYAIGRSLLEIPAGTREPGETARQTAGRELEEETGYQAESLIELSRFFTSPGWATEEFILFRAEQLAPTGHGFDHDEILDVVEVDPDRIPGLMRDGLIADAKTIIGLQTLYTHVL